MAEIKLDKSSSDSDAAEGITRRELLKTGGKVAAAAAMSSVFSPFFIQSARAATKTLSFWQFYAPNGISNLQSKMVCGLRRRLERDSRCEGGTSVRPEQRLHERYQAADGLRLRKRSGHLHH